jgi:hypothetical protein
MKAERRHELQENSLAKFMDNLPVMLRVYADRILLVVVLILLVIVLVRWRLNAATNRSLQISNDLATARTSVRNLEMLPMSGSPEQVATVRSQHIDDVEQAINNIASNASSADATMQSQALVTKGDLYWTLANMPAIPGAATQPSLALPKTNDEYLSQAEDAYQQVLKTYPDQKQAAVAAMFGLAAIAENRHNWDDATKYYTQIKSSDFEQMYKDLADARMNLLPEMKTPMLIGALPNKPSPLAPLVLAPSSQPTSQPASTEPAKFHL